MLNKIYYNNDNILNQIDIHPVLNNTFESTNITDSTVNDMRKFTMSFERIYPTIMDFDIIDSTNVIVHESHIEFLPDTTTLLDITLSDEYMKLCCDELCTEDNKFKLKDLIFSISEGVSSGQDQIFFNTSRNQLTDNTIIYDYILNPLYGQTLYNSLRWDLIPKRELVGFVSEEQLPEYTIKCIDEENNVTYHKIYLNDLGYTSSTGLVSSTFYEIATEDDSTSIDLMWHSCKTLYILLNTGAFKLYFKSLRELYSSVHLIIKIKNQNSDISIFIRENQFYFIQYRGARFYYSLDIKNIDNLVDYNYQFLTRGMYLKFYSPNLTAMMKEYDTIGYHINDINFEPINFNVDKSLLESDNYIEENLARRYIPLELYKDSNVFSVTVKDQFSNYAIDLFANIRLTLLRQVSSHRQYSPSFNTENTKISINDHLYIHASERFSLINKNNNIPYFHSRVFNYIRNYAMGFCREDLTSIFEGMAQDLKVYISQRKLSNRQSLVYVQFKQLDSHNYLKRWLSSNSIDIILNNILLSITKLDNQKNTINLFMQNPTTGPLHVYSDEYGNMTYLYLIDDIEVININGVFNKQLIESNYSQKYIKEDELYIPCDVVIIGNNKT